MKLENKAKEKKRLKKTWFERAVFLSWYCSKGDCKFCYMSTQKSRIKNPSLARRRKESILAEALICRKLGWKIEFLSGGYESYNFGELVSLVKDVHNVYGEKLWLNIGVLNEEELRKMKPYIKGVCGAVEAINPKLRKEMCPSKPLGEIEEMLDACGKLGLKKSITIIIGLGEKPDDFLLLRKFIKKHMLDRVTFYALNPHKGTMFKKGPESRYYAEWIRKTRQEFPKLQIIAGSWVNRLDEIPMLLDAGADAITKFPSIKLFGTRFAMQIEEGAKKAGFSFSGSMARMPSIDWKKEVEALKISKRLKMPVLKKLESYLSKMRRNIDK